jgi:predicted dehydrogenase
MLRFGILGAGGIVARLYPSLLLSPHFKLVAIAARSASRAAAAGRRYRMAGVAGYANLLRRDDIDAVYIALPESLHGRWAMAALKAGKHVLCEKTLAPSLVEVEAILKCARAQKRRLMEGFMYGWHPQFGGLQQAAARLQPRRIRVAFSFYLSDMKNYRASKAMGGGALNDIGCYTLSAARRIAGREALSARGRLRRGRGGVDMGGDVRLDFGRGLIADLEFGFDRAYREEIEVYGEQGSLRLQGCFTGDGRFPLSIYTHSRRRQLNFPRISAHRLEFEEFAKAVKSGQGGLGFENEALAQARAMHMLRGL